MTTADADHAIAQVLDAHEAAYHPGIACPETQEGRCAIARPVESPEDRMAAAPKPGPTFATYLDRHDRNQLDARAACAEAERDEALDTRDVLRQQLDAARAELGSAQELLAVVDDVTEQLDRGRARYATRPDTPPVEAAGDDQAEEDDLRSPLAAERDQLVETIGRLVSLPPEQIANMHKVGYSGMSAGLGSAPPRAQGPRPGQFCTEHFSWLCQAGQGRCQGKREG